MGASTHLVDLMVLKVTMKKLIQIAFLNLLPHVYYTYLIIYSMISD